MYTLPRQSNKFGLHNKNHGANVFWEISLYTIMNQQMMSIYYYSHAYKYYERCEMRAFAILEFLSRASQIASRANSPNRSNPATKNRI